MGFQPLLAAVNDWIVPLVTILLPVAVWVLNQVFGQLNQQRPGQPRPGRPQPPPAAGATPEDEVQEFLKRVRQRRQEVESMEILRRPEQPPAQPKTSAKTPQRERGGKSRGQRQTSRAPLQPSTPPTQPRSTRTEPPARKPLGARLSEQVARDIDTSDVTERARQLSKLDQADEQMEARVQSHFNRKLGSLEATVSDDQAAKTKQDAVDDAAPCRAEQLLAQLSSPDGLRQAVLMREIFDRPTHRW